MFQPQWKASGRDQGLYNLLYQLMGPSPFAKGVPRLSYTLLSCNCWLRSDSGRARIIETIRDASSPFQALQQVHMCLGLPQLKLTVKITNAGPAQWCQVLASPAEMQASCSPWVVWENCSCLRVAGASEPIQCTKHGFQAVKKAAS